MNRVGFLIGVVVLGLLVGVAPVEAKQNGCGGYDYFLPQIFGGNMAQIGALEALEKLTRQPADFPYDGHIVEVFPESVNVKLLNSEAIKRNVPIPDHIPFANIRQGVPVKLDNHLGQPILIAIFPQLQNDLNYAGRGSAIPAPPAISVAATRDGWLVSWPAVPYADRYRLYQNDTPNETTPDDLGYITATSTVIPYESPYLYFAARTCSGLNESELSGWKTDDTPPPVPTTFTATNNVDGHRLAISVLDAALNDVVGFKGYEIEQANNDSGTGALALGMFGPADFPMLIPFGVGTVKHYRVRSVDWAGNASAWTSWDYAYSGRNEIEDKFDGYGGATISPLQSLYWLKVSNCDEPVSDLTPAADPAPWQKWFTSSSNFLVSQTLYRVEGMAGLTIGMGNTVSNIYEGTGTKYFHYAGKAGTPGPIDLEGDARFTDDDFFIISMYIPTGDAYNPVDSTTRGVIIFYDVTGQYSIFPLVGSNYTGGGYVGYPRIQAGWNYLKIKRSLLSSDNADWSQIDRISIRYTLFATPGAPMGEYRIYYDDIRIAKADPDNAAVPNDTGRSWDVSASTGTDFGEWHVYEGNVTREPAKPFSYGQIKTATIPTAWYISHKPLETIQINAGTIQAGLYFKDGNGHSAGLAFFVKDVTPGSWDMYTIEANIEDNQIILARWENGTRTQISSTSFASASNSILWLGADFRDYDAEQGRIKVFASYTEGNLIQASNMIMSAQDTTLGSGGSIGLLSHQTNVRFVNFVAGSPDHAAVADVARALDGPILGPLVLPLGGELVIASGAIEVAKSFHTVDTEGDASTDDLVTVSGGVDGMSLILQAADSARTVVCKDGSGNLSLAGDMSLDNAADTIMLFRRGGVWYELARSSNGA